jgi:hypothetical protein
MRLSRVWTERPRDPGAPISSKSYHATRISVNFWPRQKSDINIGDTLIVDGYGAKDGSRLVDSRRVTLPDGRNTYGGTPGDCGPGDTGPADGGFSGEGI